MANRNRNANRNNDRANAIYRNAADRSEGEPVSRTVVEAVAALEDAEPTDLPVLAAFVDPDALDGLFGPKFDGTGRETDGRVGFGYAGYRVTVESDGAFAVRPVASDE